MPIKKYIFSITLAAAGVALFATMALCGDAKSDYEKGVAAYNRGDVIAAITLLRQAADLGHVAAMVRLGYVLDKAEENEAAFAI